MTRFEAYAARRTREAIAAPIEPFSTEIDRASAACRAIGNAWTERRFDGPFYLSPAPADDVPAASLVFVQSRDGDTVADNPSALGGGDADKHLIYEGLSRVAADAVMSGAATIRGSKLVLSIWHPELVSLRASLGLPRHPIQIVATSRGLNLDDGLMFNEPALAVLLITAAHGAAAMRGGLAARPWITPLVMRDEHDLAGAFRELRQRGVRRLSCIGGRTIAAQLIDAGLIQEVYLTTSARSAGEPNTPLYSKPLAAETIVRKRGSGADAGVVFEHLLLSPTRPNPPTRPT
jgi:riboflavin biosynthesis pyrimidine reductase